MNERGTAMGMKIIIVSAVYHPEPVVSAQMGRDLAVQLNGSGNDVTVLCPQPSRPVGANYAEFRMPGVTRHTVEDGVNVGRLPSFSFPGEGFLGRLRESISFGRHVCRYLKQHLTDVDVIYANTWPLFSQALIARHCARRRIPLVLHIQDIYPESLLNKLPRFYRGIAASPLMALDRWIARRAARAVVISENMRRSYINKRDLTPEKVVAISNWADEHGFERLPNKKEACARYGVPSDRFTFLYLGNIGPLAGVELLIDAFNMAHLPQAQLVIIGDGSAKRACIQRVKSLGQRDVCFISDPEARNVPLLQSLGDVCLLPLRKGAGMSSIPSKLMAYLFSAKPVLATVDLESDTALCVREAQCGWVGEPENIDWLCSKMVEISALAPTTLSELGHRGREFGLKHFSREPGVRRLADVVLGVAKHRTRSVAS